MTAKDQARANQAKAIEAARHDGQIEALEAAIGYAQQLYRSTFDHGAEPYGEIVYAPCEAVPVATLRERIAAHRKRKGK